MGAQTLPCSQNNTKSSFWNLSITSSALCFYSLHVPFLSLPCSAFQLLPCAHRAVSELASRGPLLSFRVSFAAPSPHQGPAGCGACPQETQEKRESTLGRGLASAASPHSRGATFARSHRSSRMVAGDWSAHHPACSRPVSCLLPRGQSCGRRLPC